MSGVVLRCPNCGTTQVAPGECDACHEGDVRHFCTNHKPGVWLDGGVCSECGSRFGDAIAASPAPPRRTPRSTTPPPTWTAGGRSETKRPPDPRRARSEKKPTRSDPFPELRRAGTPTDEPPPGSWPPPAARVRTLDELLEYFLKGGRGGVPPTAEETTREARWVRKLARKKEREARHAEVEDRPETPRPARREPGLPIVGCIVRFVVFIAIIIALGIGALFLVVGGNAGGFITDIGQATGLVGGIPEQTKRGIAAYTSGDLTTATRELSQAEVSYPRSGLASTYLGLIRIDAGDLNGAAEHLTTAVVREPDNSFAHRELGRYYLMRADRPPAGAADAAIVNGNLNEADRYFARALVLDPRDRVARGYRACTLARLGAAAEASDLLAAAGAGPWQECITAAKESPD